MPWLSSFCLCCSSYLTSVNFIFNSEWVLYLFILLALDIPINIIEQSLPLDQLGISLPSAIAMDTAAYVILAALTITVTGLVVLRLLLVRRHHIKIMGEYTIISVPRKSRLHDSSGMSDTTSPYLSIISMLVESYALDCAWSIGTAILASFRSPIFRLFVTNDSIIKVCDLITARSRCL